MLPINNPENFSYPGQNSPGRVCRLKNERPLSAFYKCFLSLAVLAPSFSDWFLKWLQKLPNSYTSDNFGNQRAFSWISRSFLPLWSAYWHALVPWESIGPGPVFWSEPRRLITSAPFSCSWKVLPKSLAHPCLTVMLENYWKNLCNSQEDNNPVIKST